MLTRIQCVGILAALIVSVLLPQSALRAQTRGTEDALYSGNPPAPPVPLAPPDGMTNVPIAPNLRVVVSDPEADSLTVTFCGRDAAAVSPDFTIVPVPDTQFYVSSLFGGTPAHFTAQTDWIVAHKDSLNIAYICQLGDCVQNGDLFVSEWQNADASLSRLEDPLTTNLPQGLPYGVAVGNHDQSPWGDADNGTTNKYNQYFGVARFTGRAYYGGHYKTKNNNHYELFEAGGLTFITISLEYDTTPGASVLNWADSLLAAYRTRRGIVYSHYFIETGNPAAWGAQGLQTYNALKDNPNLFLMLCGHVSGEGRRLDAFNGDSVYTLLSDYQSRSNGGDGWMRTMQFSPAANQIRVKTYSPTRDQYETDNDSQFTLAYDMRGDDFHELAAPTKVASGSAASLAWPGRRPYALHEWFVMVSDGSNTIMSPTWRFTTGDALTGVVTRLPDALVLGSVRPNPTRGSAEVTYSIGRPGPVTLSVFDVEGRLVRTLTGLAKNAGPQAIMWDGCAGDGSQAPPGLYLLRIESQGARRTAKLALIR